VSCHTNITGYPHPALQAQTLRDVTIQLNQDCATCHKSEAQQTHDGAHAKLLAEGNKNAAVCTDCHGAHNTQPPGEPRSSIPQTCERCHSQIYSLYKDSVHGSALIGEGNPDVPSCVDCHGVHNIQGPVNSEFRLYSPNICAKCHANQQLMDKYHINTDVFNTYLSDFHGTTVQMFQALAPGQDTNKPVCIDCHGVHDIKAVTDPNSTVIKENILATCKKCHPDATTNFPGAWLSHYPPSPTHNSLVFFVQSFYKIFIPTVIGGMAIFVVADAGRRIYRRREGRRDE
jgi:predicted CXXCH cytochrome family protein